MTTYTSIVASATEARQHDPAVNCRDAAGLMLGPFFNVDSALSEQVFEIVKEQQVLPSREHLLQALEE